MDGWPSQPCEYWVYGCGLRVHCKIFYRTSLRWHLLSNKNPQPSTRKLSVLCLTHLWRRCFQKHLCASYKNVVTNYFYTTGTWPFFVLNILSSHHLVVLQFLFFFKSDNYKIVPLWTWEETYTFKTSLKFPHVQTVMLTNKYLLFSHVWCACFF